MSHPRHCYSLLFSLLLLATPVASAQDAWEHMAEPYAGIAYPPLETPDGIIVYVPGVGLQISRDMGVTWGLYGANPFSVIPLAYSDSLLLGYAGGVRTLYQIWGNGDSLGVSNTGFTGRIFWAEANDDMVSFVMSDEGLWVSDDIGRTWQKRSHDFSEITGGIVSFGFDGDRVLVAAGGNAWLSEDLGETFRKIGTGMQEVIYNGTIDSRGNILLGTNNGIHRSSDGAESFEFLALSREVPMIYGRIGEDDEGNYYVGTNAGMVYRISADGLLVRRYPIATRYPLTTSTMSDGTVLIADLLNGIWRSSGDAFVQSGMPYTPVIGDFRRGTDGRGTDGRIIVPNSSGIAWSDDHGETWGYVATQITRNVWGYREAVVESLPRRNGQLLLFGEEGTVVRYEPGWQKSREFYDVIGFGIATAIEAADGSILVLSDSMSARSTDDGLNWSPVDHTPSQRGQIAMAGDGTLYSVDDGRLYRSSDNGATFSDDTQPIDSLLSITEGPEGSLYLTGLDDGDWAHAISTDDGTSWDDVALPCAGSEYYSVEEIGGKPGLGVISDCGVQYWDHATLSWKREILSLPEDERTFTTLFHSGEYLFAGGSEGIFRRSSVILTAPGELPLPEELDLSGVRLPGEGVDGGR